MNELPHVTVFTDGACSGNPGPGGWGAILRFGDKEKELKGGEDLPNEMIDEGAKAVPENYRNWLVKPEGLEITFDPYQVGPYVAGPQYVTIPYKALIRVINPAGPLAPFLK